MQIDYPAILEQLAPYKDKVFFHGMSDQEINGLESDIQAMFPGYFREFLKRFGVRQDFVFGLCENEERYKILFGYLPDSLKSKFISIGDNGGEDHWLLNRTNEEDTMVYEWQHWQYGEVVPLIDFNQLLQNSLSQLPELRPTLSNSEKKWCVQFSIKTKNEELIYQTLGATRQSEWILEMVSPEGVYCYKTSIKLNTQLISFRRQEYHEWQSPHYYFNMREPVEVFATGNSLIKELDSKLKAVFETYTLGDYGILILLEKEDE